MRSLTLHKPNSPHGEDKDEPEPGSPPVEPDKGPFPPANEPDPEHERVADPDV